MAVDKGTGTTVAFGTSSYSVNISSISISGEEVPVIDATHMGTTGYREKIFGDLVEPPEVTVEIHFDPDNEPPVSGAVETVTITFPLPAGQTTAANMAGTAKIVSWDNAVPLEDIMTGTYTIKFDGFTGPTWTASA